MIHGCCFIVWQDFNVLWISDGGEVIARSTHGYGSNRHRQDQLSGQKYINKTVGWNRRDEVRLQKWTCWRREVEIRKGGGQKCGNCGKKTESKRSEGKCQTYIYNTLFWQIPPLILRMRALSHLSKTICLYCTQKHNNITYSKHNM